MALAEAASIFLAAFVSKFIYVDVYLQQDGPAWPYLALAFPMAFIFYLFAKHEGLYEFGLIGERVVAHGKVWGSLLTAFLVLLGVLYGLKFVDWYSRGWVGLWFVFAGLGLMVVRIEGIKRIQALISSGQLRRMVAIYGEPGYVDMLKAKMEDTDPLRLLGNICTYTPKGSGSGHKATGSLEDLKVAVARDQFDTVIIGVPSAQTATVNSAVKKLSSYAIEILLCTELDPIPSCSNSARNVGQIRTSILAPVPVSRRNFMKASLDRTVAALALLLLSPLFAVIALLIVLDSPGPVFFRQRRYGKSSQVFRIWKFRTMTVAEDGNHVEQAKPNDPRVTRVGRFLRRSSIDELPQLINVLLGDMSIVGPRPHALAHDVQFEQQHDLFLLRRRVLPGLTGWAQVNGMRGETRTPQDIRDRLQFDLYYIENWSFWFDLEIIIRTVFILFRKAY